MTVEKARKPPPAPRGLAASGRALWKSITSVWQLDARELALLDAACRQADAVAALELLIVDDGQVVAGSTGQRRLNAAVTEARQGRLALGKLLGDLNLPAEDEPANTGSIRSQRAKHAAESRWGQRAAREAKAAARRGA